MKSTWTLLALLFSVAVNIAVAGTMIYFWRHNQPRTIDMNVERIQQLDDTDMVWFQRPDVPPRVSGVIDSLRQKYHINLQALEEQVDSSRQKIVHIMLAEPLDEIALDASIEQLAKFQMQVERLTINHLLAIKPLLPKNDWRLFLNDLDPQRKIRTKIIKLDGDSSHIFIDETEMHLDDDADQHKIIIRRNFDAHKK